MYNRERVKIKELRKFPPLRWRGSMLCGKWLSAPSFTPKAMVSPPVSVNSAAANRGALGESLPDFSVDFS